MSIELKWTTDPADLPRVAGVRLHTYFQAERSAEQTLAGANADHATGECEFLLASDAAEDVGTTTAWSFDMHCRGAAIPCLGVAWVGTIKTARRRGGSSEGIATALMKSTVARARERGFVLSALMPFRASFYQHFGYGLAERRTNRTIPMTILPKGTSEGFTFAKKEDHGAIHACRERATHAGQCDITRSEARWNSFHAHDEPSGFTVIDRASPTGDVRGWMWLKQFQKDGKDILHVADGSWETPADLVRQLQFLSTLRDQYAGVQLSLPSDVPLTRWLSEAQVPHRLVNHPVADPRVYTRMQVRVLDHARYLSALNWPTDSRGSVTIGVQESEGTTSTFRVDVENSRATVTPTTAEPDVICTDHVWASVATGDMSATTAAKWNLLRADEQAVKLLDALSVGPTPFSNEYF